MHAPAIPAPLTRPAASLNWKRVGAVLVISSIFGLMIGSHWKSGFVSAIGRTWTLGLVAMLTFSLFERWPPRLPRWIARWVLQVVSVAAVMPIATAILYAILTPAGEPPFYDVKERMEGFSLLAGAGVFVAPWVALSALVRQKEALARYQQLEFDLARSELERRALDARLQLMQAQVAPHFLFNTLANVQALVDAGSPRASAVLRSLIAYLRAAVPRLNVPTATLGEELELVRAYLELMHMRMPDRLQFEIRADPALMELRCPPMTLLTLVENAVRHGIDPSEEGGRIDLYVWRHGHRCHVRVSDTGAGLASAGQGLGTGLSTLHERLRLTFGADARLRVSAGSPRGVSAEIDFAIGGAGA